MRATLLIQPRAEKEMQNLPSRDLRQVLKAMELLCDFPRMAQMADLAAFPDVRRAVVGMYLIYYRYDPQRNTVRVFTVRHGRRQPIEADELSLL